MRNKNILSVLPYLVLVSIMLMMFSLDGGSTSKNLDYNAFNEVLESGSIVEAKVSVSNNVVNVSGVYTENGLEVDFTSRIPNTDEEIAGLMSALEAQVSEEKLTVVDPYQTNPWLDLIMSFVPFLLIGGFAFFVLTRMNNGGNNKAFEFSKTRARLESDINVKFDDVAGCEEEKEEMRELIEYLKNPKKFSKMGARIPKGILMVGPPGTGKTLLAKAVAGEADAPFYSISGSDFVEMFVGVGASRVRDMFKKAQQTAPCMIFIDEIDAVGRERGAGVGGGHDEREQTLNQLLVEMDGITDNSGVLIISATNRPDVLDPALLRPGRFDRQITVNLPDRKGRKEILHVHARNKKLDASVDLDNIAKRTPGFSGADLENVLNEAAILAVRENKALIDMRLLDEAIDRVMMGPAKKSKKYSEKERKLVAYHESGHAIIGLKLNDSNIVQKITIIPRGVAGGYNLMTPKEEKFLNTKTDLMSRITGYLGGRVAEEVFFKEISTGASNDIEEATKIARAMVTQFGMSELGPIQYQQSGGNVFLGRDYSNSQNTSGQVAFEIDQAIRQIIDSCYAEAKKIITENSEDLIKIADALLEHDTLTAEQIEDLLNGKEIVFAEIPKLEEEKVEETPVETNQENTEEVIVETKEETKE